MKLGTYSTIDVPTKQEEQAQDWLTARFKAIGGTVRRIMNPHDFGSYPSFEIDYPDKLEGIDTDDEPEDDAELDALIHEKDIWHDKANAIEAEYSKKFSDFL